MKHRLTTIILTLAAMGVTLATQANAITFTFQENGDNVGDLGANPVTFTESGVTLTANGFLTPSGTATDLYAKDLAATPAGSETGLGIAGNVDPTGNHEITSADFVQLTLPTVPATTFNMVIAGSTQHASGDVMHVYFTTHSGTLTGFTQDLGTISSNFGTITVPAGDQTGFIDITADSGNVLLHSVTVTPVPEPYSLALLALGAGILVTVRRRISGALLPR